MDHAAGRAALVRSLERAGIADRRVLDAIARVPRERFVPPDLEDAAYEDRALPIGSDQTISQPYVVARMTELLEVRPTHRVLEIGGGSGYQAAVLALLAREVLTIERHASLAAAAAERLRELGYANVRVIQGDGSTGCRAEAPFDGILLAAATPAGVDATLVTQLTPGGRLVAPVGARESQELVVRHADGRAERHGAVRFVPLLGERGFDGGRS